MAADAHPEAPRDAAPVTVDLPAGSLHALGRGDQLAVRGIRYATAERFAPAVPVERWTGILDATAYGPQCPQRFSLLEQALGSADHPASDDCLSLNVVTPGADAAGRPVLVWIHGGGFTTGTSSMPWYDGGALARRGDVVVVSVNYRLGAWGFAGRSNLGLHDIVLALRWVRANIGALGGDPERVTIFGESAGGCAVVALMAMPSTAGLFQAAYAMSPSLNQLRGPDRADEALAAYLRAAGAAALDELRDAPVDVLLDAQAALLGDVGNAFTSFSPCVGSDGLPADALERAAANPVPLVVGTTRDEMHLFSSFSPATAAMTDAQLEHFAAQRFGEAAPVALAAYRELRPGDAPGRIASAIQTDEVFRVPARRLAEARVGHGTPTWMYWFTWATPAFGGVLGSCHALDIPFTFHNLDRPAVHGFTGDAPERRAVADAASDAVLRLATDRAPGWPAYDLARRATLHIDVTSRIVDDPEAALRTLW
jgi:para-nitrobenzyl esterase